MTQKEISDTLNYLVSQLTPDVHTLDAQEGWAALGCYISFQELGPFGLRVSANEDGFFLFEAIFQRMDKNMKNYALLNDYNLSTLFRAAIDEDGYLNIDATYFGIEDKEKLKYVFAHYMHLFSDNDHLAALKALVLKTHRE